jgi:hypothetical protein
VPVLREQAPESRFVFVASGMRTPDFACRACRALLYWCRGGAGLSVLLGNSPTVDLMGLSVGHLYFFLEDVLPEVRDGIESRWP